MLFPKNGVSAKPAIPGKAKNGVAPAKTWNYKRFMTFLSTLAPVAEDLVRVDALIRARLDSDVPLVSQVAEYIVASGGKRLRPALVLLACGAAGFKEKPGGESRL